MWIIHLRQSINQSILPGSPTEANPSTQAQQLPGCMVAWIEYQRGRLDHSWLSSPTSRPLPRPPARPCLAPTTTRMMIHQQQRSGMQWLLTRCLLVLSLGLLLMVVAVPSAGAASVSTRESSDLRDEVGFGGAPGLWVSEFVHWGDLLWRRIRRIRAFWELGLGLGGANDLMGIFLRILC